MLLNKRGQAFDAFKLLIAAVVAGAILVIILSMLGGFITPGGDPVTVMAQSVQSVRGAPGSGTVSSQIVQFQKGQVISTTAIETKAGVNEGTVHFCGVEGDQNSDSGSCGSACPDAYSFNPENTKDFFSTGTNDNSQYIKAENKVSGKVWVYNCGGDYYIGFTTKVE